MVATLTHAYRGDVVVFQIGMTLRKPHRPDLWLPVAAAMPRMLGELYRNKAQAERGVAEDLGFLGGVTLLGAKGPWVVQYWRSAEQLYRYASDPELAHLPAWRSFNRAARRNPGGVGIWHETYAVPAEGIETLYANGAVIGLGAVAGTEPVEKRGARARQRLGSSPS
ncbi:DUF4188 domain-containing protein [Kocuria coralli]|uniref:DUF4188 domain-containing protein n=1 Tax=Kocuria coralli TaxID=1461025 RepID=A0A5J5L076_9MICC|nr:DUF4188 domain-containing protein [Kocuria coralli]KAA9395344.1 DUF4188 domain-containing protein [Kocuria coralli]